MTGPLGQDGVVTNAAPSGQQAESLGNRPGHHPRGSGSLEAPPGLAGKGKQPSNVVGGRHGPSPSQWSSSEIQIQELEHCFPLMRRPDWTTYREAIKQNASAVDAWTQGSLRTRGHGERAICPLCNAPVSMKHLVWECCCHEEELRAAWRRSIQANENGMLWASRRTRLL